VLLENGLLADDAVAKGINLFQRLGIDIVVDNPHVGENLQNYIFTGLVLEARDDVEKIDAFSARNRCCCHCNAGLRHQGDGPSEYR
jgi:hypothetical protein